MTMALRVTSTCEYNHTDLATAARLAGVSTSFVRKVYCPFAWNDTVHIVVAF